MSLKERQSNFELLRIIGIFVIIMHHTSVHGIWLPNGKNVSLALMLHQAFFKFLGPLGNWIFILISGYFIANSTFNWKRVFRQWLQFITISASIGIIFFITKVPVSNPHYTELGFVETVPLGLKEMIKSFMPTYFGLNWFLVAYMAFYLFIPFLNPYLKKLDKKTHFNLTLLMFVLGVVIPFLPKCNFITVDNLFNFMFGYFFANYIKLYNPVFFENKYRNLLFFMTWCVIYIFVIIIFSNIGKLSPRLEPYEFRLTQTLASKASITAVIPAVFLLTFFRKVNIKSNKLINILASTSLGVYLIHDNPFVRNYLWHVVFKFDIWKNSPYLLLYTIIVAFIVFICCALIELIRKNIIEKPLFKIIDKHWK